MAKVRIGSSGSRSGSQHQGNEMNTQCEEDGKEPFLPFFTGGHPTATDAAVYNQQEEYNHRQCIDNVEGPLLIDFSKHDSQSDVLQLTSSRKQDPDQQKRHAQEEEEPEHTSPSMPRNSTSTRKSGRSLFFNSSIFTSSLSEFMTDLFLFEDVPSYEQSDDGIVPHNNPCRRNSALFKRRNETLRNSLRRLSIYECLELFCDDYKEDLANSTEKPLSLEDPVKTDEELHNIGHPSSCRPSSSSKRQISLAKRRGSGRALRRSSDPNVFLDLLCKDEDIMKEDGTNLSAADSNLSPKKGTPKKKRNSLSSRLQRRWSNSAPDLLQDCLSACGAANDVFPLVENESVGDDNYSRKRKGSTSNLRRSIIADPTLFRDLLRLEDKDEAFASSSGHQTTLDTNKQNKQKKSNNTIIHMKAKKSKANSGRSNLLPIDLCRVGGVPNDSPPFPQEERKNGSHKRGNMESPKSRTFMRTMDERVLAGGAPPSAFGLPDQIHSSIDPIAHHKQKEYQHTNTGLSSSDHFLVHPFSSASKAPNFRSTMEQIRSPWNVSFQSKQQEQIEKMHAEMSSRLASAMERTSSSRNQMNGNFAQLPRPGGNLQMFNNPPYLQLQQQFYDYDRMNGSNNVNAYMNDPVWAMHHASIEKRFFQRKG